VSASPPSPAVIHIFAPTPVEQHGDLGAQSVAAAGDAASAGGGGDFVSASPPSPAVIHIFALYFDTTSVNIFSPVTDEGWLLGQRLCLFQKIGEGRSLFVKTSSSSAAGCKSGGQRAPFSTDTASYTHTDCSLARPLLTYYSSPRPFSNGIFRCDSAPSSFPCARPLLPSSDRSAGQRNQPSHSTLLARPVCPFVCVRTASFPCRFSDLGLNFLLASAYCTRAHTLSLDTYSRPTAGKSSSPSGLSTLVYAYVVDRAPASPYTYSSSTHRFLDGRTPIEATPLSATSAELNLGLGLGLGLGSLAH
jgi:hypothetical protein